MSKRMNFGRHSVSEKNFIRNKSSSCKRTIVDKMRNLQISSRTLMYKHSHRKLQRMKNRREEKENSLSSIPLTQVPLNNLLMLCLERMI